MEISDQIEVISQGKSAPLAPALSKRVAAIFKNTNNKRRKQNLPNLTDGPMFTAVQVSPQKIVCEITEYSRFIAQMRYPELFPVLKVRPVAISGAISTAAGWLLAKRAKHLTQYAGHWEFAPAGGLKTSSLEPDGRINIIKALFNELSAETGLQPDVVKAVKPFCISDDDKHHVIDITCIVESGVGVATIKNVWDMHKKPEHDDVCFIKTSDLADFVTRNKISATTKIVAAKLSQP